MNSTKTIITALAIVAGAVFATQAVAKKKQEAKAVAQPTVQLNNGIDSLSYAAGQAMTDGLIPFIQQQHHVDTAYINDFVQGMRDAIEQSNDPRYVARQVGAQIAQMAKDRMLVGLNKEFEGTPDSIKANLFYEGFIAAVQKNTTLMNQKDADAYFKARVEADSKIKAEALSAAGKAWLAENAKKPGVVSLPSGLQYKVITEGKGPKPTAQQ